MRYTIDCPDDNHLTFQTFRFGLAFLEMPTANE